MSREKEIETVLGYPESYLNTQIRGLENRINQVELTDETYKKIVQETSKEQVKGVGKEVAKTFLGPLSFAVEFIDWNKTVDNDLKEAKKSLLLVDYINKVDSQEKAINDLKETMGDVYGNTLVNKIFQMLDDFPPDGDLMKHLVTSLKKVCESKRYEDLFEVHKFNLNLIESLSPQALTLLADQKNWPSFNFSFTGMTIGNKIEDTFQEPFINEYFRIRDIHDPLKIQRGIYILSELHRNGFLECRHQNSDNYVIVLTELGKDLYKYLS